MLHKPTSSAPSATGSAAAAQATAIAKAKAASRIRGQLMQMALRDLLNQVRGARDALPHLAALEMALGQKGIAAVSEVPAQWLPKITMQLGSLPIREDDRELNELLRRLTSALQAQQEPRVESQRFLSGFHTDDRIEVNEVSHSEFAALMAAAGQPQPQP